MTPEDLLTRLLGDATLAEVAEAFSGTNPFDPRYEQRAAIEQRGDKVNVTGHVHFEGSPIGRFHRRLLFQGGFVRAQHLILALADSHRGRHNGRAHYVRALRFYDQIGLRFVHLMADGDGPRIWPQFGFDLDKRTHKERLRRILREMDAPGLSGRSPSPLRPRQATIKRKGRPVGQDALYELWRREDLPLSMTLDLADPLTRDFLPMALY
jgi:hypothetical protein